MRDGQKTSAEFMVVAFFVMIGFLAFMAFAFSQMD